MGFLDKLKNEAETTVISDHALYTGKYREEVRHAFLSGAVAALVFLDGDLSESDRSRLVKLGKSLHLAAGEIEKILQTVTDLGESEQLPYLKDVFALMYSEFLKYSLLKEIHGLYLQDGELTVDQKDFLNAAAAILYGKEKDIHQLLAAGAPEGANSDGLPADFSPRCIKTVKLPGGSVLTMLPVSAGTFTMGSPEDEDGCRDKEEQHKVTLTRPFWLGETPVTRAQWQAVMGKNLWKAVMNYGLHDLWQTVRGNTGGDNLPVEEVSWEKAMAFCRKLNRLTAGKRPADYVYSLPTEAQWEYACRAGTTGAYNVDGAELKDLGWYDGNSGDKTHPVKEKRPNAWGFYDMHGNVWEWCADWHGDYGGDAVDPVGKTGFISRIFNPYRVCRGGSWINSAGDCRSAFRGCNEPGDSDSDSNLGFRVALVRGKEQTMLKQIFKVFCTIFKVFAWIIIIGCAGRKPK